MTSPQMTSPQMASPQMALGLGFHIHAQDGAARSGLLETAHGEIATPAFMPVGTRATVKGLLPEQLRASGTQMILANAYHLALRPGAEEIAALGGLHHFMRWSGPILTDSGGFQIFSLPTLNRVHEEGVLFRSHYDGARVLFSPERAIEVQALLGSDITMMLDHCAGPGDGDAEQQHRQAQETMERSLRWAERCMQAYRARPGAGIFAIVQGGVYADLRQKSAQSLRTLPCDGFAIGGLALGEPENARRLAITSSITHLPVDKPRYLMGMGKPEDIVAAVALGVDLFDCVLPTRCGRSGHAFTWQGNLNLRNAVHQQDKAILSSACGCPTCASGYSRAYLHHLVRRKEILASILLTLHNVHFYQDLMATLRQAITTQSLEDFRRSFRDQRQRARRGDS